MYQITAMPEQIALINVNSKTNDDEVKYATQMGQSYACKYGTLSLIMSRHGIAVQLAQRKDLPTH